MAAVNTLNGTDLGGRNMLVREDREDRDVKAFNRENGQCPPVWSRCTHSLWTPALDHLTAYAIAYVHHGMAQSRMRSFASF